MPYRKVKRREFCIICGRSPEGDGVSISVNGYCVDCGLDRAREAVRQMKEKRGVMWEKWLAKQQAYIDRERG